MTAFTTKSSNKRILSFIIGLAFWLALWQLLATALSQRLLLCTPADAFFCLAQLAFQGSFWRAVGFSLIRIAAGFVLAVVLGTLLAALSSKSQAVRCIISPAVYAIKAAPVASFIILLLIWLPSKNLSIAISFMMALPIIYSGTLAGISDVSPELLEMATVFSVSAKQRIRYIYVSQIMPFFRSACQTAAGLCFKAGIAAEVIAIPKGSIGERLYQAKIYLDTPELFAWTIVTILLSAALSEIFSQLLDYMVRCIERT